MSTTPSSRASARADRTAFAIGLLVLALAFDAHALSSDREKDLEVFAAYNKSVMGKASSAGNFTLLQGNVRMEQGSLKARGDEARLFDAGANSTSRRMVLTGKPAHLEQRLDGDGGLMTARAAEIDYDDGTGIAVLTGDVVVIQEGKSEFRGPRMTYNTNTGAMEGGSQAPGSEVRMIFKAKKPAVAKPASS
ncbi:MAG: lipopolysaccharide transport periplasmic protein LptA [Xanthomonadales bacterium]|nr:lipopolysaccharide transport periplasmic protein LptA [Xanthomonadales bacterium]